MKSALRGIWTFSSTGITGTVKAGVERVGGVHEGGGEVEMVWREPRAPCGEVDLRRVHLAGREQACGCIGGEVPPRRYRTANSKWVGNCPQTAHRIVWNRGGSGGRGPAAPNACAGSRPTGTPQLRLDIGGVGT